VQSMSEARPVSSDEGQSRFDASLRPSNTARTTNSSRVEPSTRPAMPLVSRILVVDDNKINQQIVSMLLKKRGYVVDVAGTGAEALEMLERQSYGLVFMDVQMPGLDGLETTDRIRSDGRWNSLPVVAMTAHAMSGDRDRCLSAGMNGYISKPFNCQELLLTVERYVKAVPPAPAPQIEATQRAAEVESDSDPIRRSLGRLCAELAPQQLETLAAAVRSGKAEELQLAGQRIQDASRAVFARTLQTLGQRLEQAASVQNWPEIEECLNELRESSRRIAPQTRP
jgi:two-component system sensor histidine kinase/response regulator